jgi:hypothetical protein
VFRLFLALNILFFNLQACNDSYKLCQKKVKDSNSITTRVQIPITKNQRLIFSQQKPKEKILKHDPFLSLYLVKTKDGFNYPFEINKHKSKKYASINNTKIIEGKIVKKQVGLNQLATFSKKVDAQSVILNSCCFLEGIVTPRGIIQKEYIEHFLRAKDISYADIGIRVKQIKTKTIVDALNPFIKKNSFLKDDIILAFDGKKVTNSADLMRWILFSKIGSSHKVKVKRGSKIITLSAKSQKRYGGGVMSDTFLESLGISFDKNLRIIAIEKKAKKYQLKLGDKLLKINKSKIKNQQELRKIISKYKNSLYFLFDRDNFQFFVKVN